jgi:asparagine synthase (glutamine-hydrolysing)
LPAEIWQRPKRPYRAPIQHSFFNDATPEYVSELLSPRQIENTGLFKPASVNQLVNKAIFGRPLSETDEMALVGILSSQLVYTQFIAGYKMPPPLAYTEPVKVCAGGRLGERLAERRPEGRQSEIQQTPH